MNPLVSVIVPTKNSSTHLGVCLDSIKNQTYQNIEIIVVDNFSNDNTKEVTLKYTDKFFAYGPERSAQVNYGVEQARGEYIYKVDSDFILDPEVVEQCIDKAREGFDAVIVHNSPDVRVSWIAKIRKFEVDMYKYDITHSSARFVKKTVYLKIGGFNSKITAGEDYDFQNKLNRDGIKTGFIDAEALHLGEPKKLWPHLLKYYDYGKDFVNYQAENLSESKKQLAFGRSVYLKNWKKFLEQPLTGCVFIIYNLLKFSFGGFGYVVQKSNQQEFFKFNNHSLESKKIKENFALNNSEFPFVSFLIPTLNADKYLDKCLESIHSLDYAKNRYEIIVADGGSNDKTLEICSKFDAKIIFNPKKNAECGKYLAYKQSKGEYICLIDSDNVISSKDWLKKMIDPLLNQPKILGVESNYLIAKDFKSINKYATLLVIADPLARMLASKPYKTTSNGSYLLKHYSIGSTPVSGANGFIWRKSIIEKYLDNKIETFEEANLLQKITDNQESLIANVYGIGIYHYYCESLSDYMKKRRKIAKKLILRRNNHQITWVDSKFDTSIPIYSLYLISIVGPSIEAVGNIFVSRQTSWFWHPIVCFVTIVIYTKTMIQLSYKHE